MKAIQADKIQLSSELTEMHSLMNYDSYNQTHTLSVSHAHTLIVFLTLPKKQEYTQGTR